MSEDTAAANAQSADFVPKCLDCDYDLTGLGDGRCPECGHAFTRKRLVAAYQARRKQRENRLKHLWHLPLGIAYVPLIASFGIDDYLAFALNALVFVIAALFWYLLNRDRFIEGAHWLLALQIPLLGMGLGAATLEHGLYAVIGVVAIMSLVAVAVLRTAVLRTAFKRTALTRRRTSDAARPLGRRAFLDRLLLDSQSRPTVHPHALWPVPHLWIQTSGGGGLPGVRRRPPRGWGGSDLNRSRH